MRKRLFAFLGLILAVVLLAACGETTKKHKVTFDVNGGTPAIAAVEVEEGKLVAKPADPTKAGYNFVAWYLGDAVWNFETDKVTKPITLVAKWEEIVIGQAVRFIDHRQGTEKIVEVAAGDQVPAPEAPTRDGYRFCGWYKTKAGQIWNDMEPQAFPLTVVGDDDVKLYAYWEPLNSAAVNYSSAETYISTMVRPDRIVINPLEYRWSHEDSFVGMLSASLYGTEVDWDLAIEDGIADYPGDFSKIVAQEYSITAFDYRYILVAAAEYPVNENGDTAVVEGVYDRDLARTIKGYEWTYVLRDDLKFEDGTPIDARTYEYTLKQWLDPEQNVFRANMWYKNEDNENGRPILNAEEYLNGEVEWEEVGFKLGEPDENGNIYTFKLITWEQVTMVDAVSMGNSLTLVHPEKYAASIDPSSGFAQYGTPNHPYVSYGAYVLKEWDANARLVFNKNYDYVLKETINYKSQVIEIVSNTAEAYNLFKRGDTSVLGLTKDYYAEFAEDERVKKSWEGFPQYMIVNQSGSMLTGEQKHTHPTIIYDQKFRQALMYGFNNKEFAYTIYAPNTPSIMPIPVDAVHYLYDPIYYSESEAHRQVVEELGFELDDYLYAPETAKSLFNEAYEAWLEEGNSGPVTLRYISDNDEFSISIDNYIKESYENLFKDENGNKRLIIDIVNLDGAGLEYHTENLNFDLSLVAVGFGHSEIAWIQYAAFALNPTVIGGRDFGLNHPFYGEMELVDGVMKHVHVADYLNSEIEVDLSNGYNYMKAQDPDELSAENKALLNMLDENGIYKGPLNPLLNHVFTFSSSVYYASPEEPFPGASHDLHNLTAAFEKVFLEYVPLIPTVTRSNATIYADYVQIDWPAYSNAFGWGAARYRYLITDPDFADRAK